MSVLPGAENTDREFVVVSPNTATNWFRAKTHQGKTEIRQSLRSFSALPEWSYHHDILGDVEAGVYISFDATTVSPILALKSERIVLDQWAFVPPLETQVSAHQPIRVQANELSVTNVYFVDASTVQHKQGLLAAVGIWADYDDLDDFVAKLYERRSEAKDRPVSLP